MRSKWLATGGVALACLPCLLTLLIAVGIGTSAFSALAVLWSRPALAAAGVMAAGLLLAGGAFVLHSRRAELACDIEASEEAATDMMPAHRVDRGRTQR